MISFFIPIRKGSKRVKNKNIKKLENYKLGLTELKINQLKNLEQLLEETNYSVKILNILFQQIYQKL